MKLKEELAAEFAMEWLEKNKPVVVYDMAKALYLAGFDAGFQRAVEMLRERTPEENWAA